MIELGFLWGSLKLGLSPFNDRDEIAKNLFVDVSQNPSRHPWSFGLHRITRKRKIYSYAHDRVMSAFEAFRVYGWQNACQPIKFKTNTLMMHVDVFIGRILTNQFLMHLTRI